MAVALLLSSVIGPGSANAQGGTSSGGPGCVQGAQGAGGGGAAGALQGGNRSDSGAALANVIGLIVANANALNDVADVVAAINALNSNNINAQVVCLNNVLNANDIRILETVLNNNNVLNNSPILSKQLFVLRRWLTQRLAKTAGRGLSPVRRFPLFGGGLYRVAPTGSRAFAPVFR
jgi:hypothetical protein